MFCCYIFFGYPTPLANIFAGILVWPILQRLEAEHVLFDCQAIKFFSTGNPVKRLSGIKIPSLFGPMAKVIYVTCYRVAYCPTETFYLHV